MANHLDNLTISEEDKKDIIELDTRIKAYQTGKEDEERFKLYRLTRGVYGQRQLGVQMFRIKIPYGHLTTEQLIRIADVSDRYATGNLHITTRQDIQLHHVKLEDSPNVWIQLAEKNITAREACGNTVRNVTASAEAGIDPDELFDVTPYAHALAHYFLRNPICQEMGRKIKIAFSSTERDSALTFMHDFGFVPKVREGQKGFKVVVGGGLGAVAMFAHTAYEFLPTDEIIPFVEAGLRVFDRYGEREKRNKARLKFLLKKIGIDTFLQLIAEERKALVNQKVEIDIPTKVIQPPKEHPALSAIPEDVNFITWKRTNTFEQKQQGYYGVYLKVPLGDLASNTARALAPIIKKYAVDDIRLTINQNILLQYVPEANLYPLYQELSKLELADPGYDSPADVTACPGTDTCNLGVTNSTSLAQEIDNMINKEYPDLLDEKYVKIKISGCMNACGQHTIANIGFHGSSIKRGEHVIPAMQILLGGGIDPDGKPYLADKVIKIPTKRILDAIRTLLDHFDENAEEGEYFNHYYERLGGKKYFYSILKSFADLDTLKEDELIDWGHTQEYIQAIGVGECAGAMLDMVSTILQDANEKQKAATFELENDNIAEAAYYTYSSFVIAAKALLLSKDIRCNTQIGIIDDFVTHYVDNGEVTLDYDFKDTVLTIKKDVPTKSVVSAFLDKVKAFLTKAIDIRAQQLEFGNSNNPVISNHYTA